MPAPDATGCSHGLRARRRGRSTVGRPAADGGTPNSCMTRGQLGTDRADRRPWYHRHRAVRRRISPRVLDDRPRVAARDDQSAAIGSRTKVRRTTVYGSSVSSLQGPAPDSYLRDADGSRSADRGRRSVSARCSLPSGSVTRWRSACGSRLPAAATRLPSLFRRLLRSWIFLPPCSLPCSSRWACCRLIVARLAGPHLTCPPGDCVGRERPGRVFVVAKQVMAGTARTEVGKGEQ